MNMCSYFRFKPIHQYVWLTGAASISARLSRTSKAGGAALLQTLLSASGFIFCGSDAAELEEAFARWFSSPAGFISSSG